MITGPVFEPTGKINGRVSIPSTLPGRLQPRVRRRRRLLLATNRGKADLARRCRSANWNRSSRLIRFPPSLATKRTAEGCAQSTGEPPEGGVDRVPIVGSIPARRGDRPPLGDQGPLLPRPGVVHGALLANTLRRRLSLPASSNGFHGSRVEVAAALDHGERPLHELDGPAKDPLDPPPGTRLGKFGSSRAPPPRPGDQVAPLRKRLGRPAR